MRSDFSLKKYKRNPDSHRHRAFMTVSQSRGFGHQPVFNDPCSGLWKSEIGPISHALSHLFECIGIGVVHGFQP